MRLLWGPGVLAILVLWTGGAQAGVYLNAEPPVPPFNMDPAGVQLRLVTQRQLEDKDPLNDPVSPTRGRPSDLRGAYLDRVKELETKQGTWQPVDQIDLGGLYIRLGRYEQARKLLEKALPAVQGDKELLFLLELNLAYAYAHSGDDLLPKAAQLQEQALSHWPQSKKTWNPDILHWYRRAEELVLLQLKDRVAQARVGAPASTNLRLANVLFPRLSFEGPEQAYEIGNLRPDMWTHMPPDAIVLVLQLLYAELLNANGNVTDAADVLKKLVDQVGTNSQEMRRHRQLLVERTEQLGPVRQAYALAWDVGYASSMPSPAEADANAPVVAPTASANWLPDWRPLIVGFLAGMLTATLGGLQWREWRRKAAPVSEDPVVSPPVETPVAHPTAPADTIQKGVS
jgi:tetratricopeptide (TPR) repeat protein